MMSGHSFLVVHCSTTKCHQETFLACHAICWKCNISMCDTCKMAQNKIKNTHKKTGPIQSYWRLQCSGSRLFHFWIIKNKNNNTLLDNLICLIQVYSNLLQSQLLFNIVRNTEFVQYNADVKNRTFYIKVLPWVSLDMSGCLVININNWRLQEVEVESKLIKVKSLFLWKTNTLSHKHLW